MFALNLYEAFVSEKGPGPAETRRPALFKGQVFSAVVPRVGEFVYYETRTWSIMAVTYEFPTFPPGGPQVVSLIVTAADGEEK